MSLADHDILQLTEWLHALEEGTLEESQRAQFEAMLAQNDAARRFYVQRMTLGAALCKLADEAQGAEGSEGGDGANRATPIPQTRRKWPASAKLALAAALALCGIILSFGWNNDPRAAQETSDAGCAVLMDAAGVKWAPESRAWQSGMSVPAGKLALESGMVRLEFYSGASVTLEGRSELEIVSVNEAKCRYGQMRVHVPSHARGFKLTTPDARVVDLGTEFGLKVTDSGKAEVHVFDGEVEVYPQSGNDKLSVKQGAGWNAANGLVASPAAAASSFADLAALRAQSSSADAQRMAAWRTGLQRYLKDPRLLVGYTFEPEDEWQRTVRNHAPNAAETTHGSIVGARWMPGRWQGKKALEFKSPGDRVRLAVPGQHRALTFCAWVQLGGIDRKFNSLFLTDTWAEGNPHWQFVQNGSFVLGVHERLGVRGSQHVFYSPESFGPDKLGVWYHIATSFDMRSGVGRHYVNGNLVTEFRDNRLPADMQMKIGSGELGNWGLPEGAKPRTEVRTFNGRMDEFLLFGDALPPEDIGRIYELGRPN
jgi:ferric-dicitrate binding protein FerR (iron transport regulator)